MITNQTDRLSAEASQPAEALRSNRQSLIVARKVRASSEQPARAIKAIEETYSHHVVLARKRRSSRSPKRSDSQARQSPPESRQSRTQFFGEAEQRIIAAARKTADVEAEVEAERAALRTEQEVDSVQTVCMPHDFQANTT